MLNVHQSNFPKDFASGLARSRMPSEMIPQALASLRFMQQLFSHFLPDEEEFIKFISQGVILDAGCGFGEHTAALQCFNQNVYGVDMSAVKLEGELSARKYAPCSEKLLVGNVCQLPFENGFFDKVISMTLFASAHENLGFEFSLPDFLKVQQNMLAGIKRALKPGGTYLIFDNSSIRNLNFSDFEKISGSGLSLALKSRHNT